MATIHQKFTGDAGQLEKEIEKLRAQQIKLEEQLGKTAKTGVEANKALQEQVRAGVNLSKQLVKENETLSQQHFRMKTELKAAWLTGKISSGEYADGLLALDKRLQKNLETIRKQKEALKNTGDTTNSLVGSVASMAAGWLSVGAAISAATRALAEYQEKEERGRNETTKLTDARKELLQVSQGDFEQLEKRADAAATKYGVDRVTARQVLFTARSEGFESDYENIVKMAPLMDPRSAARIAGQVRTLFDKEQLTSMGAINAVAQGSNYSRLSIDEMTAALPQAGEGGRQQGATLDETVAGIAVLSSVFKSGETTGDRLKMLMSKMAINTSTAGKGLLGGLDTIQAMSPRDREKFLGDSQELRAAYTAATDMEGKIREQVGAVRDARLQSTATDRLLGEYYNNPILRQDTLTRGQVVASDIASEQQLSQNANEFKAFREFVNRRMTNEGYSSIAQFGVNRGLDAMWLRNGSDVDGTISGKTGIGKQFIETMKRQEEFLREIEKNTGRSAQVPSGAQRNVHQEAD